jgi:hypothetical protein
MRHEEQMQVLIISQRLLYQRNNDELFHPWNA